MAVLQETYAQLEEDLKKTGLATNQGKPKCMITPRGRNKEQDVTVNKKIFEKVRSFKNIAIYWKKYNKKDEITLNI